MDDHPDDKFGQAMISGPPGRQGALNVAAKLEIQSVDREVWGDVVDLDRSQKWRSHIAALLDFDGKVQTSVGHDAFKKFIKEEELTAIRDECVNSFIMTFFCSRGVGGHARSYHERRA